ncbi:MAG: HypC/HybG/HupF family hydrogenase formation chaperone [Nanoarchaeota archaeon]
MCLAVPGKIIKIDVDVATLAFGNEQRKAKIIDGNFAVGDYAIAQGGILAMKIAEEEAKESLKLYQEACGKGEG